MRAAKFIGAANAKHWRPVERLLFLFGWFALVISLATATVLEFSEGSSWVRNFTYDREFTRSLPTNDEMNQEARSLPRSAKRFYQDTNQETPLGYVYSSGKVVGYYDAVCQQKADAQHEAEEAKRRACAEQNASVSRALGGSILLCNDLFVLPAKRPADECVLWSFSDHYYAPVTEVRWNLKALFGNRWFLILAVLSIVCFANFFLIDRVWIPLAKWVKGN